MTVPRDVSILDEVLSSIERGDSVSENQIRYVHEMLDERESTLSRYSVNTGKTMRIIIFLFPVAMLIALLSATAGMAMIPIVIVSGGLLVLGIRQGKKTARLQRYAAGQCNRCGTDCTGPADAFDPSYIRVNTIGPARCPECGFAWPFVP